MLTYRGEGNSSIVFACSKEKVVYRLFKTGAKLDQHEGEKQIRQKQERVKDYIRHVVKPFLQDGLILEGELLELPESDLERMQEIQFIPGARPEHRMKTCINTSSRLALKLPDFCFVQNTVTEDCEAPTFSIEIKPKCGFLTSLTQEKPWDQTCRFCLKQLLKVKTGHTKSISKFCPIDLFSGHRPRMKHSLKVLFETPQNNLRLFMNGHLLFSEENQSDQFVDQLLKHLFVPNGDKQLQSKASVIDALCDIVVEILLQSPPSVSNQKDLLQQSDDSSLNKPQPNTQTNTEDHLSHHRVSVPGSTQSNDTHEHLTTESDQNQHKFSTQVDGFKSCNNKLTENEAVDSTKPSKDNRNSLSAMEADCEKLRKLNLQRCANSHFQEDLISPLPPGCLLSQLLSRQTLGIGGINAVYPLYKQLEQELDDEHLLRNKSRTLLDGPFKDYWKPCTVFEQAHLNQKVERLKRYKFARTMMDTSIMITLQLLDQNVSAAKLSKQHNVIKSNGRQIQHEYRLIDLDPKDLSRMNKWMEEEEAVISLASSLQNSAAT